MKKLLLALALLFASSAAYADGAASAGIPYGTAGHKICRLDDPCTISGSWTLTTPWSVANGGTANSTAAGARSSSGLNIDQLTTHGDSDYSILATDRVVGTTGSFTAFHTWTLAAASSVNSGQKVTIADFAGTVTGSHQLIILRHSGDTIAGGDSNIQYILQHANESVTFVSDGISKWTFDNYHNILAQQCPVAGFDSSANRGCIYSPSVPAANTFVNGVDGSGDLQFAQVPFSGLLGSLAASQCPAATSSTQGCSKTGTLVAVTTFTAGGTWTPNALTTKAIVKVGGAGGGGGGATASASNTAAASGGAPGPYGEAYLTGAAIASQTVTIGAGGIAGDPAATLNGGTGGTTSLGTLVSCPGGTGGTGSTTPVAVVTLIQGAVAAAACTISGTGVTTVEHPIGGVGDFGISYSGTVARGGGGNAGRMGASTVGVISQVNGQAGVITSGGGGAVSLSATAKTGGAGGGGEIIIYEYQ